MLGWYRLVVAVAFKGRGLWVLYGLLALVWIVVILRWAGAP